MRRLRLQRQEAKRPGLITCGCGDSKGEKTNIRREPAAGEVERGTFYEELAAGDVAYGGKNGGRVVVALRGCSSSNARASRERRRAARPFVCGVVWHDEDTS